MMNVFSCVGSLFEGVSFEVFGDSLIGFIVNVVREKGEEVVRIFLSIFVKLKIY